MAVIIDMAMPEKCIWNCPLCREDGGSCQLDLDVRTSDTDRPSNCPLKSLDDAIDDIQTNINSMKENAKLHEKGIRQNGEMIAAGLQMALDIIDSYCKENTDE